MTAQVTFIYGKHSNGAWWLAYKQLLPQNLGA